MRRKSFKIKSMLMQHSPARRTKIIEKLVTEHGADFSREQLSSSIIQAWCVSNAISLPLAERGIALEQALSHSTAGNLHLRLLETDEELTLKDVEAAFETSIGAQRKREAGAVYTPTFVTTALIERCLDLWQSPKVPVFIDPACGSGGFLVRAASIIAFRYDLELERVLRDFIYGVDVDVQSIECTRLILELFCLKHQIPFLPFHSSILCADALLHSPGELLRALGVEGSGFDVVATNPPYVKIQNLEPAYRVTLSQAFPEFTTGSFNLSQLFLIHGHRLLSPEGVLGTITPNNIFTSLASEQVRSYLQHHRCIDSIIDFGYQKIFRNASTYTCLIFLDKNINDSLLYARCEDAPNQLPAIQQSAFDSVDVAALRKEKWRLAAPRHLANIERMERCGIPLGQLADIRVGFATLKDSVFLIEDALAQDSVEFGITTPAIKIASFSDEDEMKRNRKRLIRPYRKQGERWFAFSEDELRDSFPRAYAHLLQHKTELEKRDKGKQSTNFFEWGRTQGMEAPGPKLLTKTFNRSSQFLMDETNSLFCNGYSVRPKAQTGLFSTAIDIGLLQKILNSCVMNYYIQITSVGIEGGYWCYQKNFIENFCIPDISEQEADTLFNSEAEETQLFICQLFGLNYREVMEYLQV